MRQPTISRAHRRTRQQRLLRTGVGFVVIVALIVLVGKLFGGDGGPKDQKIAQVNFVVTARGESDGKKASGSAVEDEGARIGEMLNDWYQRAFVDPKLFGDGTFAEVAENFAKDARARFPQDIESLTIGRARSEVARVTPVKSTALVTIFFEAGSKPRFATAAVKFQARASLKQKQAFPLQIVQEATLHLERQGNRWLVTYYDASQKQDSIIPSPSPVAT